MLVPFRYKPFSVLVRGIGDVGSAVIWQLKTAGFDVMAHEDRKPRTIRRKMAYADAYWYGRAVLDGIEVVTIDGVEPEGLSSAQVGLYTSDFEEAKKSFKPDVIVDARVYKTDPQLCLKGQAALTIGVGPFFEAGVDVDLVVESCWGPSLGHIITEGRALEPVPNPPAIKGVGWQRFVRAHQDGKFTTQKEIGECVAQGDVIATLGNDEVIAPIDGVLRGLLQSGIDVSRKEKLIEIDPRLNCPRFNGLAERPEMISKGVLNAVQTFIEEKASSNSLIEKENNFRIKKIKN